MPCRARDKAALRGPCCAQLKGWQRAPRDMALGTWLLLPPQWCWAWAGDHEQKGAGAERRAQLLW